MDSNVLSALMQAVPEENVARWLDQQPRESIWITTTAVIEVRAGLQAMPLGKKRSALANALGISLAEKIQGRIAAFDMSATEEAAELTGAAKS